MKPLAPPPFSAAITYRACVSGFDDPALRVRLAAIAEEVVDASNKFELAASYGAFFDLPPTAPDYEHFPVSKKEFDNVYTVGMVRHDTGRAIYDRIKGTGKCPSCQIRDIRQLDHYMPRNSFPYLAVTPLNLVPICSDCNFAKRAFYPKNASEVLLHPYFDDISGDFWLTAELEEGEPPTFHYKVVPPITWSDELSARVTFQFEMLNLAEPYGFEAVAELLEIQDYLADLHGGRADGQQAVRDHLADIAASRANVAPNGWRAAAYSAMAASDWFCRTVHARRNAEH